MSRVLALAVLLLAGPAAAETSTVFTRADAIEATAGEVEVRQASTKRLELPSVQCGEGKPFSCDVDAIYGQVWSIDFFEITDRVVEGRTELTRTERGRMLLAMDLSPDDEAALDDAVVEHLRSLSAIAFVRDRPGVRVWEPPLEQSKLSASSLPVWACAVKAGAPVCDVLSRKLGNFSAGELSERGFRVLDAAVAGVVPKRFGTTRSVRLLARHRVTLETVSTLGGQTWADRLATVPEGVQFEKKELLDGQRTGSIWDRAGDAFRGRQGIHHGVQRSVLMPPASLSLYELPMWVTRWHFQTVHERFGADHLTEPASGSSIVIAVLPLADPLMSELARSRTPLEVPERALVDLVVGRLEESAELTPGVVKDGFADAERWPKQGDWLVVTCLDDGTSRYGIAPFPIAARVTNSQEACAAIIRELAE